MVTLAMARLAGARGTRGLAIPTAEKHCCWQLLLLVKYVRITTREFPEWPAELEFDPHAWREGHDPQLEKAVAVALEELKQHPAPELKRPLYPSYDWTATRAAQAKAAVDKAAQ